jgi:hypothetical protein
MATEKWIAGSGVGLTWTSCFQAADLASMASGSSVLSSTGDITNGTALDIFADFSINFASIAVAAPNYVGVYLYPLNQDGSTYGDNNFVAGTQKAATPSSTYYKGGIAVPTGTAAVNGILTGIIMPPGTFRLCVQNNLGIAMSASTNTAKYRTYNRSVA